MPVSTAWRDRLARALRLDTAGLALQSAAGWPWSAKVGAAVAVFAVVVGGGCFGFLSGGEQRLAAVGREQERLRRDHERKSALVANLPAHPRRSLTEPLAAAVDGALPPGTAIPALLEDITRAAETNGLVVRGIDLLAEQRMERYSELPLHISVRGGYHDIGAFAGAVAGLARLVTLHDFELGMVETGGSIGDVRMTVLAKAYRWLGPETRVESRPSPGETAVSAYRAGDRRSPFEPSISGGMARAGVHTTSIAPDLGRPRHYLERHAIDALAMVGTLSDRVTRQALVRDGRGRVHRLAVGHYLGEDHGRIREIGPFGIEVVEIVPDGAGGWVQRSRLLPLSPAGLAQDEQE